MRKSLISILMVIVFSLFAKDFDAQYERISGGEMKLDFTTDITISVVEKDGVKYSTINGAGSTVTNDKGYAEIPFHSTTVQLKDDRNVTMDYTSVDYEDIVLDHPLLPSRGTIFRNQDPTTIPYEVASESIKDEWYPGKISEITDPFILRDVRGTNVLVYPYQYNAKTNTLRVYKTLEVSLIENVSKAINPITNSSNVIVRDMDAIYRSLFINYNDDSKFANQLGELGDIHVIYTSRDASVIQPYITWKRENGFKVSEEQVSTGTNVVSTIQNAYDANNNILYVQLVGDWADITCNRGGGENEPMDPETGCVVGTDDYPDIIIGRFSAETTVQVTIQVNKGINYEKNPDLGGTWYKNGLGIGSPDGSGIGDDLEIDYDHIDIIKDNKLLPYNYTTVNEAYGTPTAATVAGFVNSGLSIINYCGHGASTYWVTSGYDVADVYNSTNGDQLPFIFSVACVNGSFDNAEEVFSEAWLRKENGGAVAVLMSTINQPWVPPMIGQDYFNDIITEGYDYSSNPGSGTNTTAADARTTFGSVSFNGNILMLAENPSDTNTLNTIKTWTLFGDASVQIRTDTPTLIDNSNTTLLPGNYTTTITTSGNPVEGAKVTLYQGGVNVTGLTNSSGTVSLDHGFAVASDVTVTITGYNLETEQSVMMVTGDIGGTFAIDETSLSYGSLSVGGSSILQFTITNSHNTETLTGDITTIAGYTVSVAAKGDVKDVKNTLGYAVPTNSAKTFDLTFAPTSGGTFNGDITITSSDTGHATEYIAVTGTGIVPDINLNPGSITASTAPDATDIKTFNVENTDIGQLDYSMTINYTSGKEIKGGGGPDTYGYKWIDSDSVGVGPVYSWVEINGLGTAVPLTDDSESASIDMEMTFPFYGTDYTSLVIGDNGAITFTGIDISATNATIPTSAAPNAVVAPFWDDLNCGDASSGDVYYYYDSANSRFIVEYDHIVDYGSTNTNTFQILLYQNGKIVFQYDIMNGDLEGCTIGIESPDGTDGSLVRYNSAYLKNELAIQFQSTPEWLSLDSNTGSINGIGSDMITATFDATDLEVGVYTADIYIASNDPDESTKILPVTFNVAYGEVGGIFALDNPSLSYGGVGVGSNIVKTFEITNSHGSEYLMGNITTISGYTVSASAKGDAKNVLDYTISPNSSKVFDLTFAPLAEGDFNGNITITSTDTNHDPEYIAVTGIGTVPVFGIPFSEDFNASTSLPSAWEIVDNQGNGQVWEFGTHTSGLLGADGNYAYLNSDAYGSGNSQNTDLVTPKIDMSNAEDITLSFTHYYNYYSGDTATLSYSIDGGGAWIQIQQWSADITNPTSFSQVINALDGESNVKIKWNFTGSYAYYWDVDDILITGTITGLTAPENPATTTVTASEANLSWDVVAGATIYYIYRSTDPYSGFALIGSSATPDYQDSDVAGSNKYFYYITADNAKK